MKTYKIIYSGIILPGYNIEQVRPNISRLLKLTEESADVFFSGKRVLIKKDLTLEKALSIKETLEKNGLSIKLLEEDKIETLEIIPSSKPEPIQHPPVQPKKFECSQKPNKIYLGEEDPPSFFNFSFDGRYGRLNYMNATWAILGVTLLASFVASFILTIMNSKTLSFIGIAVIIILMQYYYIRAMALRFHDLNKTGWLSLLFLAGFIPIIGGIFNFALSIYLMAAPGTHGDNDYGEQPKQGHIIGLILTCFLPIIIIIAVVMFALPAYKDYNDRTYVAEGLALSSGAKLAITEYYLNHKTFPSSNQEAHLPDENMLRSTYVTSIKVIPNGKIMIQYNGNLNFGTIILTPKINFNNVSWECNQGTIPAKIRPAACR